MNVTEWVFIIILLVFLYHNEQLRFSIFYFLQLLQLSIMISFDLITTSYISIIICYKNKTSHDFFDVILGEK